jgi:transposase
MGIASVLAENERLRRELAEHQATLAEHQATLAERDTALAERDAQIAALKASNEDLAQRLELQRLKIAGRRNERHVEDPSLPLPFVFAALAPPPRLPSAEAADPELVDEKPLKTPANRGPNGRPARRKLAERTDRPIRKVRCAIDPTASCTKCGRTLRVFGTAHTYRLEWVPGHFEILDVERERCACPHCPSEGVLVAPPPNFALPRALCGNGLLARVLVDKFADRIPLNLQAQRMEREGEPFSTATLSDWVLAGAAFLKRIAVAIDARLLAGPWLQADDTGYPVQDGTDGKLRKGRLWAVTDQQEVRYHFTDTKEGQNPARFLADFQGKLLLVDGGSEFNLAVAQKGLLRAGCWSHLRRYFYDARHHYPREARLAIGTIRDLFAIEAGLVGAPLEVIREVRNRDSRPLVDGLFEWVLGMRLQARPSSLLGEALTYAVNGREFFTRFLDHPELPMHNNRSEFALRGPVVGRKQWLFAGSEGGAHAGATMFTLVGSCMLQGIDPWAYLTDVLTRLPDHPVNKVHELTPRAWRLAREGASAA